MVLACEPMFVRALVTVATVEQFDIGVPIGATWLDEEQRKATYMCPHQHDPAEKFLPVVGSDRLGEPAGQG